MSLVIGGSVRWCVYICLSSKLSTAVAMEMTTKRGSTKRGRRKDPAQQSYAEIGSKLC